MGIRDRREGALGADLTGKAFGAESAGLQLDGRVKNGLLALALGEMEHFNSCAISAYGLWDRLLLFRHGNSFQRVTFRLS